MKNSADLGRCYPPRPSASVDNTFLDLQNSSYPTQPHSIIAKYISGELPVSLNAKENTGFHLIIKITISLELTKKTSLWKTKI